MNVKESKSNKELITLPDPDSGCKPNLEAKDEFSIGTNRFKIDSSKLFPQRCSCNGYNVIVGSF